MTGFAKAKTPLTFLLFMTFVWAFWQSKGHAATPLCAQQKILIVPPPLPDYKLSGWFMQQAKTSYLRSKKLKCGPFFKKDVSTEIFDFFGMDARNPETIESRQLEFIKERTAADQLMFLSVDPVKKSLVALNVYKLIEDDSGVKIVDAGDYEMELEPRAVAKQRSNPLRLLLPYLTPNALSFGVSNVTASLFLTDRYREVSTVNRSTLPAIISSIQISKIEHPDSFGLFDYSFNIFPGLFFFAIDQYTTIEDQATEVPEYQTLHLQAIGANANLNAELTLHSPIGATYISAGAGPSYYARKQDDDDPRSVISPFDYRFRIGHRSFFTKNLFIAFDFDQIFLSHELYHNDDIVKQTNLVRGSATLGWYFPSSSIYY